MPLSVQMSRSNSIATAKLQVTVDIATEGLIEDIAMLGIHGTNKAEVVSSIIRMWLWENHDKLRDNGISIGQPKKRPR